MSKTRRFSLIIVLFLALFLGGSAYAIDIKDQDTTIIAKDEIISSTLIRAGSSLVIDGKVQGDVICLGQSITINGFVDGDVLCAGQSITINGEVRGNVRAVGNSVVINGKVARNVMVAGSNITLGNQAQVGWDMMFAGAMNQINGSVKRDVDGVGARIIISGNVARNVYLMSGDNRQENQSEGEKINSSIVITKGATINGDFNYKTNSQAQIEDGATIKGTTTKLSFTSTKGSSRGEFVGWIWWRIICMFAALLVGLILVSWLKKPLNDIAQRIFKNSYRTIGIGFLIMIVIPIVCFILAITIIGLPLALIFFVLWLTLMYLAKIIVAIIVGNEILKRRQKLESSRQIDIKAMIIGIVIAYIIFSIPVIGWLACLVATLLGLGMVWHYGREKSTV